MKLYPISFLLTATLAFTAAGAAAVPSEDELISMLSIGTEQRADAITQLSRTGTAKCVPALAKLLGDRELSDYARNALELIKDPAAGQALVAALGSKLEGRFLTGVVITLGDRKEKAAVPAMKKLAADAKSPAADAALSSLALIATDEAADGILAVLKTGPAELKLPAAHAALRAAGRMAKENPRRATLIEAVNAADVPANLKKAAADVR